MTAVEVIEAFAKRWTIEQLFSVAKQQGPGQRRSAQGEIGRASCRTLHSSHHLDRDLGTPPQRKSSWTIVFHKNRGSSGRNHHPNPFLIRPSNQGITPKCTRHRSHLQHRYVSRMKTRERPGVIMDNSLPIVIK